MNKLSRNVLGGLLLVIFILNGCNIYPNMPSEGLDLESNNTTSTYNANIKAATIFPIEVQIGEERILRGMKLEVVLEDDSLDEVFFNLSYPPDIGQGENAMVINGYLIRAFKPESLPCFLKLKNISLKEISVEEATKLNNPYAWIWYGNKFFQFQAIPMKEDITKNVTNCSLDRLWSFKSYEYTSPVRVFPRKITIELTGEINDLFFNRYEIKPMIVLSVYGEPIPDQLHTEFINLDGSYVYDIPLKNNSFIFDKKLKLNSKYAFIFPFDSPYAEINNISPTIIREKEIPIEGKLLNLDGTAYLNHNNIKLKFKRKPFYKLKVIMAEIVLLILLIMLKRKIKYLKKHSLQFKIILKNAWSLIIPIIGSIITITYSFEFIFNLLSLIPLFILVQILFLIPKKVNKLKK